MSGFTRGGASDGIAATLRVRGVTPPSVVTVVARIVVRGAVVVGVVIRGVVEEGAVVPKADPHAARSVVAGDEVPNGAVVIPARVNEHVVSTRCHVVSVDPDITARAVIPVPIDPDRPIVRRHRPLDDHRRRRRGSFLGGGGGLRLLDDDHGLAFDLLARALPLFDHDVVGRVLFDCDVVSNVAVTTDHGLLVLGLPHVTIRPIVGLCTCRKGDRAHDQRGDECEKGRCEWHGKPSFRCTSGSTRRHPPFDEQARPARQVRQKVLGFGRFRWTHGT